MVLLFLLGAGGCERRAVDSSDEVSNFLLRWLGEQTEGASFPGVRWFYGEDSEGEWIKIAEEHAVFPSRIDGGWKVTERRVDGPDRWSVRVAPVDTGRRNDSLCQILFAVERRAGGYKVVDASLYKNW
ncbi:MAG: hypothetical protein AAF514_23450 [Verrucomicrobiota bacterium]